MFLWYQGDNWQWKHLHSEDGGGHWTTSLWNNTLAFMPYNVRQAAFAYHPVKQDTVRQAPFATVVRSHAVNCVSYGTQEVTGLQSQATTGNHSRKLHTLPAPLSCLIVRV
jgi:hypothetical protein